MHKTAFSRVIPLILAALLVAPSAGNVHAQSLREQVVGTWKLVKWTFDVDGVEKSASFGPDTIGRSFLYVRRHEHQRDRCS
jgi:hypothetical protein